jgi:plastocyanin
MARFALLIAFGFVAATPNRAFVAAVHDIPGFDVRGTTEVNGRTMANAVVWIDVPSSARPSSAKPAVLDQRNVQFVPQVLAVQTGTRVSFPNNDRVFHNVFSFHESKRFDLGLYPVGMVKEVPFDKPGLSRVYCNIHPQMAAYVMVVDTPYFAVSDASGQFTIAAVPAGTWHYHGWYPGGTILNDTFTVAADAPLEVRWK